MLAIFFAGLSATMVQRVQQLANQRKGAKIGLREAEARNSQPVEQTP